MRKAFLMAAVVAGLLMASPPPTVAQDESYRAEVGLLFERLQARSGPLGFGNYGMDGFQGTLTVYPTRWVGLKAEAGGTWGRPSGVLASLYSYHFGAQFAYRSESRWTPWAHSMVGRKRVKFDVDTPTMFSVTARAVSFVNGGGVDVQFHRRWAWRVGEVSHVLTRFEGRSQHSYRFTSGFLFRW